MRDPFAIDSPTCISFSGGRTSAYMLWRVLQSNNGLPPEAVVCFANTGKEEEQTLEFVRDCGERWNVEIHWLEYNPAVKDAVDEVSFESASRNGEPFEAIIRNRTYLPNPVARFCTADLKIRPMHRFLRALGWTEWQGMVGIRADEQRRVVKLRNKPSPDTVDATVILPLADANVTLREVNEFWAKQPFSLNLTTDSKGKTTSGNCDLCFLKGKFQIMSLIRERPQRAEWWARMESTGFSATPQNEKFRQDRPGYAAMLANVQAQQTLFDDDEEAIPCFCGE